MLLQLQKKASSGLSVVTESTYIMAIPIPIDPYSPTIMAMDLDRLLTRLERRIMNPNHRLKHDSFERTRTSYNVNQALTLLLRLEPITTQEKITSRRREAQSRLIAQRAIIKKLTNKLHQLEREDDGVWSDEEPEPNEEIMAIVRGGPLPPHETISTVAPLGMNETTPSIRNRHHPPSSTDNPITTGASLSPFASKLDPKAPSASGRDATAKALENDSDLQSNLTQSLVTLATTLKTSSQAFSAALQADDMALRNATGALDKNTSSMEMASKNMGLLRRMSEGKGWWGRMMLYAWIAGLWVVAILLVFVGPKLRF